MSERQERVLEIEDVEFPNNVREVYVVPPNPPIYGRGGFRNYPRIYPIPWWKRCYYFRWLFKHRCGYCCCCCCNQSALVPAAPAPAPPAAAAPPTIVLRQGMLAIGGLFYLLITPQGSQCQFVLEWNATGGAGQLTVDLDVQNAGSTSVRRLATGRGPNDQYIFTGPRAAYLFKATVTDSRGQSTFGTLSVTCP